MSSSVCVVGAGLGGSLVALLLARSGYRVTVYERRSDPRREAIGDTSMNLGLSRRGLASLERVGLAERALERSIPMLGRVVHRSDGVVDRQPYGSDGAEVIHAIRRGDINALLIDALDGAPGVTLHFGQRLVRLDREGPLLELEDAGGRRSEERCDFVVGADGVFSQVRGAIQRGARADFSRAFLDWGWKELTIEPGEGGRHRLENHAFHLWPRGGRMLFAHPNLDGSFTCSLVLPYAGPDSFGSLAEPAAVRLFFDTTFPDLSPLIPDLEEQFAERPLVDLTTTRTSCWHHGDRVVLLGDAAHGVVPFYAQGMNAAFEDGAVLVDCLRRHDGNGHGGRSVAFAEYQAVRKPNTDALADMSLANFEELMDRVRSPWLRARRKVDLLLHGLLGERWMPLHARVTHTTVPYAEAVAITRRQDRILAVAAAGVALLLAWLIRRLTRPTGPER